MGLLEEIQFRDQALKALFISFNINKKSIMSKEVNSLSYQVSSSQPRLYFECLNDPGLSFQAHDLELGEKEAMYWYLVGQGKEEVYFNGQVHRGYSKFGLGTLRGYLENDGDNHRLGVVIEDRRIKQVMTHEDILDNAANLINTLNNSLRLLK